VRISFDSNTLDSKARLPPSMIQALRKKLGPDGSILEGELRFVKPGKGTAFVRTAWHLELKSKVRGLVVAEWMLFQFRGVDVALLHDGINYVKDVVALAKLIDDSTGGLPDSPASDAPGDDDEGLGVASRLKPPKDGLSGAQ